jgi:hypothetical protein
MNPEIDLDDTTRLKNSFRQKDSLSPTHNFMSKKRKSNFIDGSPIKCGDDINRSKNKVKLPSITDIKPISESAGNPSKQNFFQLGAPQPLMSSNE